MTAESLLLTAVFGLELEAAQVVHIIHQRDHIMAQHVCRVESAMDWHLRDRAETWGEELIVFINRPEILLREDIVEPLSSLVTGIQSSPGHIVVANGTLLFRLLP